MFSEKLVLDYLSNSYITRSDRSIYSLEDEFISYKEMMAELHTIFDLTPSRLEQYLAKWVHGSREDFDFFKYEKIDADLRKTNINFYLYPNDVTDIIEVEEMDVFKNNLAYQCKNNIILREDADRAILEITELLLIAYRYVYIATGPIFKFNGKVYTTELTCDNLYELKNITLGDRGGPRTIIIYSVSFVDKVTDRIMYRYNRAKV